MYEGRVLCVADPSARLSENNEFAALTLETVSIEGRGGVRDAVAGGGRGLVESSVQGAVGETGAEGAKSEAAGVMAGVSARGEGGTEGFEEGKADGPLKCSEYKTDRESAADSLNRDDAICGSNSLLGAFIVSGE